MKFVLNCICVNLFAAVYSSVRSLNSPSQTGEAPASSLPVAVDQTPEELINDSTPAPSDAEILPTKFLNRNPRYF